MTDEDLSRTILEALSDVAPETEPTAVRPDVSLRDQLDLDSFDFLRFVIRLHERLGVDIPEADYRQLSTLNACVAYLRTRLGQAGADARRNGP